MRCPLSPPDILSHTAVAARCQQRSLPPFAERDLWNAGPDHSGLRPANFTTLAHFSVSSAMSLPKSAGDPASAVPPRSAIRAFIFGSARAALISLLSLSTISAGVPFGAPKPTQSLASIARYEIAHGRDFRQRFRARRGRDRQRAQLAGPDVLERRSQGVERTPAPDRRAGRSSQPAAAIRHVDHVDTGHHLEQLAAYMASRSDRQATPRLSLPGLALA